MCSSDLLMNYMLNKMITLIENLTTYPENMLRNLNLTNGLVFSQALLLELAKKGVSRENAYVLVQRNAMECWKTKMNFKDLVMSDIEITELFMESEMEDIFSYDRYTQNIDYIYKRIGI